MIFVAALLFVLQSAAPFPQAQETQNAKATIEGVVVRAGTNEPIARARITAARMAGAGGAPNQQLGPPQSIPAVTTDSQGHFVIKDLDPGSYALTAQRNGFARQAYGERAPGRPGTPLNMVAGQTLKDVVFRLTPAGTVSGRVTDATGEPIAGMNVQIVRSTYDQNGKRTFQTVDSARTNDLGEYRIYWVSPGRYYVNASPPPVVQMYPSGNEVIAPGYVLTYYPGTSDPFTASPIEVQPGAELSTIDFSLTQQPLFRIRGRVFDARTGQFPRNASVSIRSRTPTGGFAIGINPVNYNQANGTFELRDVPPGSYWVRAIAVTPAPGLTLADMARNSVQVAVDVSNGDIENVVLAITSGFQIKGRIDLDGGPLSMLPDIERTGVLLTPGEPTVFGSPPQQLRADGTFTLENIQPGDYRVNLAPMPPNTFIESARLGQVDVLAVVTISGPVSESLEILLSTKGGQIDGTIVDKDEKALRGVQAVLIPDRQRDRHDLYKLATSDQNGHFTMRTIPPGDYKLFAWEDLESGAYNDPDIVRKYEALATPIKITDSVKLTKEVKVLPAN